MIRMEKESSPLQMGILVMLAKKDMCGYSLRKELSKMEKSHHLPSCGSVYPALKDLKENGLIESKTQNKKIMYKINERGKKVIRERIRLYYKDFLNQTHFIKKICEGEDFLLLFEIMELFEKHSDKKKAKIIINDCIKKLKDGKNAGK
jgi:PadR family transcriptional regulator, regulatory protein PadR